MLLGLRACLLLANSFSLFRIYVGVFSVYIVPALHESRWIKLVLICAIFYPGEIDHHWQARTESERSHLAKGGK